MIRILLVDDYEMVRRGLKWLISTASDLQLVGIGTNGYEAVQLCEQLAPDVALIDSQMPLLDGISATRRIRAKALSTAIIIMVGFMEEISTDEILLAGANDFLFKDGDGQTILQTIHRVAQKIS